MTEDDKKTTVHIPPELMNTFVREIPRLHEGFKDAAERDVRETVWISDQFVKIAEMRISFYEKLILLAGGSFALSVTLLGSLQRAAPAEHLKSMWCLEGAWIFLLLAIFVGWLHNRHRGLFAESMIYAAAAKTKTYFGMQQAGVFKRAANVFEGTEGDLNLSALFDAMASASTESAKKAEENRASMVAVAQNIMNKARRLGDFALLTIALAFLLMLVFAVRNAPLL